jgi:6-phosphogluconolactonase/glucosamine-6-phosphate isomerase/deaminase
VTVFAPFPPYERLSITSKVIKNAKEVIVLALTPQKYKMYMEAKKYPNDIVSLPARLVLDRHWIFKL